MIESCPGLEPAQLTELDAFLLVEDVCVVVQSSSDLKPPQLVCTSLPPSAAQKRSACRTSLFRTWCGRTMLYSMRQTSMAVRAVARFLNGPRGVERLVARGINRGLNYTTRSPR